jgi:hypothetical protein
MTGTFRLAVNQTANWLIGEPWRSRLGIGSIPYGSIVVAEAR